ncbi:hypothetical protein HK101_010727 [Irineochytrium annulatum]|nr:hypothetical protein HK101_010727 [Irineochytrium annulatum]
MYLGSGGPGGGRSSSTSRTATRGDKSLRQNSEKSLPNSKNNSDEDTPTVRQRINEGRKSGFLDLTGLGLTTLPVDAAKLSDLTALLLGNNGLIAVPGNLASTFPRLVYLDLSGNKISTIPASLAELEELEVLDLTSNEGLRGSQVPTGFGPIRHRVAIFIDDEQVEENLPSPVDEPSTDIEAVRDKYSTGTEVDSEARRFFRRLETLENAEDLQSFFARRLAAGDSVFIKYLTRRYSDRDESGDDEDGDTSESAARRREVKGQISYARQEKERVVKRTVSLAEAKKRQEKWRAGLKDVGLEE